MISLVLGGVRSGKSRVAERLAGRLPEPITYLATGRAEDGDDEMARRIAAHRARRPTRWATVEVDGDLARCLGQISGSALVDSLGAWVATAMVRDVDSQAVCDALQRRDGDTVVVSEELGMGVHPLTEVGRRFVDVLGELNQAVAAVADEVVLVVAGRMLRLDAPK